MTAWTRHLRVLDMMIMLTLLLSCSLVSACNYAVRTKTLFGEYRDQFPPVVLSIDNKTEKIDYPFDWQATTVGGISISQFRPSNDFWRLNVFQFSDGKRIAGTLDHMQDYRSSKTDHSEMLNGLPTEKLLRADLELADDKEGTKGRETYSFMFLLHYEEKGSPVGDISMKRFLGHRQDEP
jgi:hypothetical protein